MDENKKESIVLCITLEIIGLFGIIMSLALYYQVPEAIPLGIGMSCIPLVGGGILFILAWTGKWGRKEESLAAKKVGITVHATIAIIFSIALIILWQNFYSSIHFYRFLIIPIHLVAFFLGMAGFYGWSYIREKRLEW